VSLLAHLVDIQALHRKKRLHGEVDNFVVVIYKTFTVMSFLYISQPLRIALQQSAATVRDYLYRQNTLYISASRQCHQYHKEIINTGKSLNTR